MNFTDILLIVISSAGLLHGIAFAIYLSCFKKKKHLSNYLLALILVFMAFRIGKSVMLNFGDNLEPIFIFAGLTFLLLIGPLLKWYVLGMTQAKFKLSSYYYIELIPFCLLFLASFFVSKKWFDTNDNNVIIVFASVLIFTYLHLAFYIYMTSKLVRKTNRLYPKALQTKSQKTILHWLNMLIIGFVLIWISYVLNIIEDSVPYIIGPIMYSVVIYFLSFKAFQLKITDINGNVFKKNDDIALFNQISKLVAGNKMYIDSNISLSSISKLVGKSTQKTSEVINQYAKQNFNDFINYHRIQEAKKILLQEDREHHTISAIAFDAGFSSLSSFNSAFKKFEGMTPSSFKKSNT
ncbi:helix-turn-helix domain-containing protein [Flavivirga algicola]|uniref:AraC family transcriptional regulator n=1 Tax=Flavivirga algicola TaxID=2729136 RepID=A0ABX1RUU5_9FLAO|nr:helix-turn-helix domain-containing protein [Flavivirga algicola]NMH87316.1 AraC family transcriptional regulator [Flavivirga algicola]